MKRPVAAVGVSRSALAGCPPRRAALRLLRRAEKSLRQRRKVSERVSPLRLRREAEAGPPELSLLLLQEEES